jgi:hypothetical protein
VKKYLAIVAVLIAAAGCKADVSVGDATMSQADFEQTVADGVTPDDASAEISATCDGGIEKVDGATQDCVVKVGPDSSYVHITLEEAADQFDVKYQPYAPADVVEENAISVFANQDIVLDTVSCPGDIEGVEGETLECDLTSGDQTGTASVTVKSVDGLLVNLSYKLLQ